MALKDALGTTFIVTDTLAVATKASTKDRCRLVIGLVVRSEEEGGRRYVTVAKGTTAGRVPGYARQDSSDIVRAYLTRVGSDYYAYDAVKSGFAAGQP